MTAYKFQKRSPVIKKPCFDPGNSVNTVLVTVVWSLFLCGQIFSILNDQKPIKPTNKNFFGHTILTADVRTTVTSTVGEFHLNSYFFKAELWTTM